MGVWLLQLSAQAMGSLLVWIPRYRGKFSRSGVRVKRRALGNEKEYPLEIQRLPGVGEAYDNIITKPASVGNTVPVGDEALLTKKKGVRRRPMLLFTTL